MPTKTADGPRRYPNSRRCLGWEPSYGTVGFDVETNRRSRKLFAWLTGDHWLCLGPVLFSLAATTAEEAPSTTRKRVVKRAMTGTTTKTATTRSRVVLVRAASKTKSSTSPCSPTAPNAPTPPPNSPRSSTGKTTRRKQSCSVSRETGCGTRTTRKTRRRRRRKDSNEDSRLTPLSVVRVFRVPIPTAAVPASKTKSSTSPCCPTALNAPTPPPNSPRPSTGRTTLRKPSCWRSDWGQALHNWPTEVCCANNVGGWPILNCRTPAVVRRGGEPAGGDECLIFVLH